MRQEGRYRKAGREGKKRERWEEREMGRERERSPQWLNVEQGNQELGPSLRHWWQEPSDLSLHGRLSGPAGAGSWIPQLEPGSKARGFGKATWLP